MPERHPAACSRTIAYDGGLANQSSRLAPRLLYGDRVAGNVVPLRVPPLAAKAARLRYVSCSEEGIRRVRLLTNNPRKRSGLADYGLEVVERLPIIIPATPSNGRYLAAKRDKLGHLLGALGDD